MQLIRKECFISLRKLCGGQLNIVTFASHNEEAKKEAKEVKEAVEEARVIVKDAFVTTAHRNT